MLHRGRLKQRGYGLLHHRGSIIQKGYGLLPQQQHGEGLGSMFSSLFRTIIKPAARAAARVGKRAITSKAGKAIIKGGKEFARDAAITTASDLLQGGNIKDSAAKRLEEAKQKIGTSLETFQKSQHNSGNTKSRKNKKKHKVVRRKIKNKYKDIFD